MHNLCAIVNQQEKYFVYTQLLYLFKYIEHSHRTIYVPSKQYMLLHLQWSQWVYVAQTSILYHIPRFSRLRETSTKYVDRCNMFLRRIEKFLNKKFFKRVCSCCFIGIERVCELKRVLWHARLLPYRPKTDNLTV